MWFGLHFPDLELHYLARGLLDPERPLALVGAHPLVVQCCNQAALEAGITPGQRLATAMALCESLLWYECPSAKEMNTQPLQELAQWAYGFSSQVILFPPDTLVLESASMLKLFGGWNGWREQLISSLEQLALPYHWSLAHTPLSAQILGRTNAQLDAAAPTQVNALLALQPISTLDLAVKTRSSLAQMGLRQLSDLMNLPRAEIGQRFGTEPLYYLERLLGERPDPRPMFQPPIHYQRRVNLLEEIETLSGLRFPLNRLLGELGQMLQARQLAIGGLGFRFTHRNHPATVLTVQSAGPEHRAKNWIRLCQLQLERLSLIAPICTIELEALSLQPMEVESGTLAIKELTNGSKSNRAVNELLSQLVARLGEKKIFGLQALDNLRPELASQRCMAGEGHGKSIGLKRPTWLLDEPVEIDRKRVRLLQGPERIESGWWDDKPITRDYFMAQDESSRLLWLFRDHSGWFIHGWF